VHPSATPPSAANRPPAAATPVAAREDARAAPARIVAAIPARYGSTRLPAKALLPILGRPMIEHVWRRASAATGLDRVVVLTDDERIARVVRAAGGEVELTPEDCASGTDRIAWAARGWHDVHAVINVQGDEPLIDPMGITALATHLRAHPAEAMVTLAGPADPDDAHNPNAVKVVLDAAGYALYFSRAPIPYPRVAGAAQPLRHLGIYGYRRDVLLELAALPSCELERAESLEQLRALYHGLRIRVLRAPTLSRGVDTAEDLAAVEAALAAEAATPRDP
jgi:3-deoxy-manno-octulosonate cytidylyltransferase (CMP-KDO synthetase)